MKKKEQDKDKDRTNRKEYLILEESNDADK